MAPPIRYAKSDDVNIAYQVVGDGPTDLVFVAGAMTNLEVLWEDPDYRRFCERLGTFTRLLLFDSCRPPSATLSPARESPSRTAVSTI